MYDVAIIGAGVAGSSFALKIVNHAKTVLIEEQDFDKNIPIRTNIFAEHNRPYLKEVDWNDKNIFPIPHLRSNYMADTANGVIDSTKFGIPLGNICYTDRLIEFLITQFKDKGGETKFGVKVKRVNRKGDHIELTCDNGEVISTKFLAIATGSHDFNLQKSLGFGVPDQYMGICVHLHGEEAQLNENLKWQYVFHLNPKISTNGPFFINKGVERAFVGFLGKMHDSPSDLKDKLERILQNYKRIQPCIKNLKKGSDVTIGKISKHPIKEFSGDRMLILGEAAGLVTSFFYEGILCGLVSAQVGADTIIPLLEKESSFSKHELRVYDSEIHRILLKNYFRNGNACEYLFYTDASYVRSLWNHYCELIATDITSQRYIYEAYINQDLANHDINKDRYVGEKLFAKLPALSKITLSPRFLRAMMI